MPEQRKRPIVSQRLRYQRRFYLRPKFRQLRRLLGPAYLKNATPKRVSEGQSIDDSVPRSRCELPKTIPDVKTQLQAA